MLRNKLGARVSKIFGDLSLFARNMSVSETELQKLLKKLPPPLSESKHKGQAGRIGIIGGSLEYTGAPYFAGITALKCGADLTYIFCMRDAAAPIKSYSPELIVLPFLDAEHGRSLITSRLLNIHSLVIGPGLGEDAAVHALVVSIIKFIKMYKTLSKISLVFDADGIGLLADNKEILADYTGCVYLTPNANEINKLAHAYFGRRDINKEDDTALGKLAAAINPNAVLILKGPSDRIIAKGGSFACSVTGSLRRIGGQGDLLSGSLGVFSYWASLRHQDEEQPSSAPVQVVAAYAACSVTRLCSRFAFEARGRSMITSDLIAHIEKAFKDCFAS